MVIKTIQFEMTFRAIDQTEYDVAIEDLLEQINMGRTFDDLFTLIYERLKGHIPYNRIGVAILEDNGNRLTLIACKSDGPLELGGDYSAEISGSTLEVLLQTGQPRILNDLEQYLSEKPQSTSTALMVKEGMRSSLTLPLVVGGRPTGAVFFSSRQKDIYSKQHARLLKRLAGHIAISIEKAQLIDTLQSQNKRLEEAKELQDRFLEKLQEEVRRQTKELRNSEERYRVQVKIGKLINSSLDLKQVFQHAAEEVHRLLQCDRVSLLLVDSQNSIQHGYALEFKEGTKEVEIPAVTLSGSATEHVLQRQKIRIARNLKSNREFPEDHRLFEQGYNAYVYLPLVCRDESVGVLGLATRRDEQIDSWDLELLKAISYLLATALDNASAYTQISDLKAQLEAENVYLRDEIKTEHGFANIIGDSQAMRLMRQSVEQVAVTDSTVLIVGETGTGKELMARAIHDLSSRREHLLVKVNCAALGEGVITSELFGHEKSAFTGATEQRVGRFELANKGTIFLDEIAEIPPETQVLLLRVLQERVVERVGGNVPINIDVRVIAATNRDLKKAVEYGDFRSDLYYRLNVFPVHAPPLREKREDIPALMNHFIGYFSPKMNKKITRVSRRTMDLVMDYQWPGNVRELENIVERSMIVTRGDTLEIDPSWLLGVDGVPDNISKKVSLAEVERTAILEALQQSGGKVYGPNGAAKALGLKPTTLYGKMRKYHIEKKPR